MVEPLGGTDCEYFYTVGSGLESFVANTLLEDRSNTIQLIASGKVYFSSSLSPEALFSLKTAERLFILVQKVPQFLINRTKRDAISYFRAMVEGESAKKWERCINKWEEFYKYFTGDQCDEKLKFRVSCKCSGKVKNVFPSFFLGKILAGSLLNTHPKWIPELRSPQLEVYVHADIDSLTMGLACCLFNQPLSKRSYLSDIKGQATLRPTLCAAMLALAFKSDRNLLNDPLVLLDPMCGTGIILAEALACSGIPKSLILLGSDSDATQISEAVKTIRRAERIHKDKIESISPEGCSEMCRTQFFVADTRALPLQNNSVHCIVSDLPFGLKHTCKPWPNHLRKALKGVLNAFDDIQSVTSEGISIGSREINNQPNVCKADGITEGKNKEKTQIVIDDTQGKVISQGMDGRKCSSDPVSLSKRGLKRKYPYGQSDSVTETYETSVKVDTIEDARNMLPQIILEMDRVLVEDGRVVLIISETLKSCLLKAVSLVTSSSQSITPQLGKEQSKNRNPSEESTSTSKSFASDLEFFSTSLEDSFETPGKEEISYSIPKRKGWSCTEEHKVKLGILDAVICAFNT